MPRFAVGGRSRLVLHEASTLAEVQWYLQEVLGAGRVLTCRLCTFSARRGTYTGTSVPTLHERALVLHAPPQTCAGGACLGKHQTSFLFFFFSLFFFLFFFFFFCGKTFWYLAGIAKPGDGCVKKGKKKQASKQGSICEGKKRKKGRKKESTVYVSVHKLFRGVEEGVQGKAIIIIIIIITIYYHHYQW